MLDEDQSIHSEIIWTFNDVDRELLKRFPNGQSLTEELVTIDGAYTWRIDFYPNGKDLRTYGHIIVCVELVGALDPHSQVDAECSFSLKNRKRRKHYMGKMNLRAFELGHYEEDASFENNILKECGAGYQPIIVTISITQHPSGYVFIPTQAYVRSSSSTHSLNNICEEPSNIGFDVGGCNIAWPPTASKSVTDLVADSFLVNNRGLVGLSHLAAGEKPKLCRETVDFSKGLYRNHQDEFLRKKPSAVNYLYGQI